MCISLYLTNQFPTINCHAINLLVLLIISNLICVQNFVVLEMARKRKVDPEVDSESKKSKNEERDSYQVKIFRINFLMILGIN